MSNESVCGNCETIQRFYGKRRKLIIQKSNKKREIAAFMR